MNQKTKIQLLPFEIEVVSNAQLILTKNAVLQKLKQFLEGLQIDQQLYLKKNETCFPKEVLNIPPKISRGENYKGLPWLVLDNPRFFEQQNVFAIRTMFWWGNNFSVTLHLSGRYKKFLTKNIQSKIKLIKQHEVYLYYGDSEWEHQIQEPNYKKLKSIPVKDLIRLLDERSFLKLAVKIPFGSTDKAEKQLKKHYEMLVRLCI